MWKFIRSSKPRSKKYSGNYFEMRSEVSTIRYNICSFNTPKERQEYALNKARELGIKCGKWMFFSTSEEQETIVAKFKELAKKGLIDTMKYTPTQQTDRPVYIVYVEDFDDRHEVSKIFDLLVEEFGSERTYLFKPDIYTYMGIYAKDKELLSPYIFKSEGRLFDVVYN